MKNIVKVWSGIILAFACIAAAGILPNQDDPPGVITNGILVSASTTNGVITSGTIAYFSITISNGCTSAINLIRNQAEIVVPSVKGVLVDTSGKGFIIEPEPGHIRSAAALIIVNPRVNTNWSVGLRVNAIAENGLIPDIVPGDYKFNVVLKFSTNGGEFLDAKSNSLNLKVR